MSPTLDVTCTHERRPGTSACLYCRRDARLVARARHHRLFAWVGIVALGSAIVAMAGLSGLVAFTRWRPPAWVRNTASAMMTLPSPAATSHLMAVSLQSGAGTEQGPLVSSVSSSMLAPGAPPATSSPRPAAPPLQPIVRQGTTLLRDSLVAVRMGNSVTLHFDTPGARTRRPEKFEQIVRATLPAIYGAAADSLLAKIPEGRLADAGDLLTELPTRGLRLSLGAGWTLAVWPETRIGHDGPLVVDYRTTVMR